jgi:hypothetical protein
MGGGTDWACAIPRQNNVEKISMIKMLGAILVGLIWFPLALDL